MKWGEERLKTPLHGMLYGIASDRGHAYRGRQVLLSRPSVELSRAASGRGCAWWRSFGNAFPRVGVRFPNAINIHHRARSFHLGFHVSTWQTAADTWTVADDAPRLSNSSAARRGEFAVISAARGSHGDGPWWPHVELLSYWKTREF